MFIPEIPNNSLTKEITEIVQLSKKLGNDYDFEYDPPLPEKEIIAWENDHNIKIPESIKDWLRFSGYSAICSELAIIRDVKGFVIGCEFVPEDMVIIGEVIGDGQFIGFSKKTGEIIREDHGEITTFKSFEQFLRNPIIRMLKKS